MMKQRYYIFLLFVAMLSYSGYAQKSILRLSQQTLMHEVRETPSSTPSSTGPRWGNLSGHMKRGGLTAMCLTEWKKKITNRK